MRVLINLNASQAHIRAVVNPDFASKYISAILRESKDVIKRQLGRADRQTVSKAGEYPITKTGKLSRSISAMLISRRHGRISADTAYSGFLEHGTKKMLPRKMVKEALEEVMMHEHDRLLANIIVITSR